ncbi:MAG: LCP family protein [Lachnospiraceae bacterium]|nr:LCP family protein [Lachnospiraceae bacterium]
MSKKKMKKPLTKKQKRRKRRRIILICELIALIILSVLVYLYSKFGKIDFNDLGNIQTNQLDDKTKELLSGYTTIALYGVDSRDMDSYKNSNSDSMIICVIDNDKKEIRLMSVLRDTYMDVDGEGTYRKCNYAYAKGGPKESMEMLNRNLDLDIQEYVSVNWKALADAIDAVGGVEADVSAEEAAALVDPEYFVQKNTEDFIGRKGGRVKAGKQTLNGVQAVAYCRIRHGAGDDYSRTDRQREVLSQLITKVKGSGISKINKLIDAIFPEVSTSLSLSQVIGLATNISDYKLGESKGFPFDRRSTTIAGAGSIVVPCTLKSNVVDAYQFLYNKEDYEPSDTVNSISKRIINKTGFTETDSVTYKSNK